MLRCKQELDGSPGASGKAVNSGVLKLPLLAVVGGGYFFLPNLRPRSIAAITSIKSAIVLSMFMGVASFRSCRRRRTLAYGLILTHTLAHVKPFFSDFCKILLCAAHERDRITLLIRFVPTFVGCFAL